MLDELKATVCNQGQTDYVILRNEVENYSSYQPLPDEENDALLFWKRHCYKYPRLAILAKEYLCIPSSSVAVESMFSTTGLILNSKRSLLDPFYMNITVFLFMITLVTLATRSLGLVSHSNDNLSLT